MVAERVFPIQFSVRLFSKDWIDHMVLTVELPIGTGGLLQVVGGTQKEKRACRRCFK